MESSFLSRLLKEPASPAPLRGAGFRPGILSLAKSEPFTRSVLALSEARLDVSVTKRAAWNASLRAAAQTVAILTGKVSAMVFVQRLNQVTAQVQEMEDQDGELSDDIELMDILSPMRHKHELNVWKGFVPKVKIGVFFECNVAAVYSLFDHAVKQNFTMKNARSFTKNVAASAVRKSARAELQNWTATDLFGRVCRSTFRAQTLYWSALFVVSVTFDAISTLNGMYKQQGPFWSLFVPRYRIEGSFWRRTWVTFMDCAKKLLLTAIGAGVGTLIRPGIGTTVGMIFFPSLAGMPR